MRSLSRLFSKVIPFVEERRASILAIRTKVVKVDGNKLPILNGVSPLSFLYFFFNSEGCSLDDWYFFETDAYIGKPLLSALFFH